MTQQPDPFSELRGLLEKARELLSYANQDGVMEAVAQANRSTAWHVLDGAITRQLPALLDERDRLIGENERLRLIAADAALLGQVVASSYTPDHKPHTLKNPKTGEVVTGPIADAVIELVKIIIEQGNTARQALSQEIG